MIAARHAVFVLVALVATACGGARRSALSPVAGRPFSISTIRSSYGIQARIEGTFTLRDGWLYIAAPHGAVRTYQVDRQDYWDRRTNDHTAVLAVLKARDLAAGRGRGTQIPLVWLPEFEQYGEAFDNVIPIRRNAILPDDQPPTSADDPNELPF